MNLSNLRGSPKYRSVMALALAVSATGLSAGASELHAQTAPQNSNAFNIPSDIELLGQNNPNVRTPTAVVNGSVITGTDVDHRVALLVAASEGELPEAELQRVKMQVLRNLIDETLQIQEAAAQEIPVEGAQVQQRYNQVAAQNFGSDPGQMDQYLIGIGSSPASLKRQIEGEIAWNNLIRRNISPFINVSDEEAREVLQRMEDSRGTDEYRIGEIFLRATTETYPAVLENAQQIVQQLRQGGSFIAYARQFSESSTASVGGDLGFVRLETLPTAMQAQAREMQPGELRGPFDIPGGIIIMVLLDKRQILMADPRDATLSLKQISVTFPAGVTEQAFTEGVNNFTTAVASMRGCGDAETVGASIGADVVANQVTARSLPEQLQASLLNLQIGQATQPFGSPEDGVRVLMLCGRDDPEVGGGPTLEDIRGRLEDERIQKRAQRFLRDLRNDAYIESS
ncbi:peptidylprolyl isomerase [Altererythrobacter sp. RZ02]|uniref:Parvulin-like PPIase n=2 Tax=Pontixanthobacter rizhaonensis TaxID=2730337 RepID=A0A848QE40_9SPHN|nr:peptidylprolyl isomerase [Pontixanthobacter rizhaonensis]